MPNNNEYNREQSNERNPSNGCTFLKLVSISNSSNPISPSPLRHLSIISPSSVLPVVTSTPHQRHIKALHIPSL